MLYSWLLVKFMADDRTNAIRQSYDQIADEYARRIYHELRAGLLTEKFCAASPML
jgi:hypothetical protein